MSQNPHFILVTGDFNVRSSSWWKNDLTMSKGSQVDAITSSYGLSQLIRESTHVSPNSSSCIDLIFINQNNFNIFHNFIPNKNIICNDKDPPWFNNQIKTLIENKNNLFKSFMANGRFAVDSVRLQKGGAELTNIIKSSKKHFYINPRKTKRIGPQ